jgi:hypothetical protein
MKPGFVAQIWAKRRQQSDVLATAEKKRHLPKIELTDEEWAALRKSSELQRQLRAEEEKQARR